MVKPVSVGVGHGGGIETPVREVGHEAGLSDLRPHRLAGAPLIRTPHTRSRRRCPICGKEVELNRDGLFRRHYAVNPGGDYRLCLMSGRFIGEGRSWR